MPDTADRLVLLVGEANARTSTILRLVPDTPVLSVRTYQEAHDFLHRLARDDESRSIRIGDLEVEPETHRVLAHGRVIDLSDHEFRLLLNLCCDAQRAWTFGELYEAAWEAPYLGDATAVRSAMKRISRKLVEAGAQPPIESVRGFGFRAVLYSE